MPKVDFSNYEGREQAYVKHSLLQIYLPELAYRVGKKWDSLVYVDGFAGPWKTHDPRHADSSFSIAIDALRRAQTGLREGHGRDLRLDCVLVEQDKVAFAELERFAANQTSDNLGVHALQGEFVKNIPSIDKLIAGSGKNSFKFVLLDPTGWAQIPMESLKSFLHDRSSEVLVTLMTRDINRFLAQSDRAESYRRLFGRPAVLEILQHTPAEERPEQAVLEYSHSLKELCGFKYVSAAIVLEPIKESVRYFLVYATNHPRGIEVFKAAEIKAAKIQDDIRHEASLQKTGQPAFMFDTDPPKSHKAFALQSRFAEEARSRVMAVLKATSGPAGVEYKKLFCEAMFYPLVTPDNLVQWIRALEPNIKVTLDGVSSTKKPKPSEDYRVVVINPKALQ
jgi:three-Cys-motif partner protein